MAQSRGEWPGFRRTFWRGLGGIRSCDGGVRRDEEEEVVGSAREDDGEDARRIERGDGPVGVRDEEEEYAAFRAAAAEFVEDVGGFRIGIGGGGMERDGADSLERVGGCGDDGLAAL